MAHHATALNLASILDHQARLTPDWVALTCGEVQLTYAQVAAQAAQVAGGLQAMGINPGDHVAFSCPNVPWFPIAYFGILKAGAVVVPLNVLLKPREIAYHLRDSDARAMVAFEGTAELPMAAMAKAACDEAGCANLVIATRDAAAPSPIEGAPTLAALMHGQPDTFETRRRRPDDTAVILYTSGTTGQPKGAELTHENMVLNAIASRDMFLPSASGGFKQDVSLITLPLFHSTAQTCQMNAGPARRHAARPASRDSSRSPSSKRCVASKSASGSACRRCTGRCCSCATLDRFRYSACSRTPAHLHFGRRSDAGRSHAPVRGDIRRPDPRRVRSVGNLAGRVVQPAASPAASRAPSASPIFGVDIRCVDPEDRFVPAGERGEVVIRGPNVMKGYYNRPEATAEAMRDGWFHTGDVGTLDEDGYLTIVDRTKDMILRGGFNVYPREIEEVLITHPAVSLAAVIGVPDERLGEEVKAFIVRRPGVTITESELLEWGREQFAAYKYPRFIEFRDTLPIGPTGKILKRELKPSK